MSISAKPGRGIASGVGRPTEVLTACVARPFLPEGRPSAGLHVLGAVGVRLIPCLLELSPAAKSLNIRGTCGLRGVKQPLGPRGAGLLVSWAPCFVRVLRAPSAHGRMTVCSAAKGVDRVPGKLLGPIGHGSAREQCGQRLGSVRFRAAGAAEPAQPKSQEARGAAASA
jgi:hypothetical protein